jgi:uncharacterized protein (TIGR00645 family)
MIKRFEAVIAGLLIASRWLMAPLYLGLIAALIVVGVEFFEELIRTVAGFTGLDADSVILAALKLIDLVLVANLILIMISAGIGTLGSVASSVEHAGWTEFMGKVDFSGLKLKVVVSLVAIAAVDLLESFVEISAANKTDLFWQIVILATFVVTGVLLAFMDRLAEERHD